MNYRQLHRRILDAYWDDTSERVTNLLQNVARKRHKQIWGDYQPRDSLGDMLLRIGAVGLTRKG